RILRKRYPDLLGDPDGWVAKCGRHDPDDGEGLFIEVDGTAYDVRIRREGGAPQFFTEQNDGRGAGLAVFPQECAAGERTHGEDRKQVRDDNRGADLKGIAVTGHGEIVGRAAADRAEGLELTADGGVVG